LQPLRNKGRYALEVFLFGHGKRRKAPARLAPLFLGGAV